MAQPQKSSPESSLLFSLDELRQIEQDRIAAEEAERQARLEAERQAKLDSERQKQQEAAERERREIEAMRLAWERDEEARLAEVSRVEESERQARIEAETRLARERLAAEMALRRLEAERTRPRGLALVALGLLAVASILGVVLYQKAAEADARSESLEATRAEIAEIQERLEALVADKQRAYELQLAAKNQEAERAAAARIAEIDRQIAEKNQELVRIKGPRSPGPRRPVKEPARPDKPNLLSKECSADDPLGCLD